MVKLGGKRTPVRPRRRDPVSVEKAQGVEPKKVEAAGVEPASEVAQSRLLHAYPADTTPCPPSGRGEQWGDGDFKRLFFLPRAHTA